MRSNIASSAWAASRNCTFADFFPAAATMGSRWRSTRTRWARASRIAARRTFPSKRKFPLGLGGTLSGVQELIGACQHFFRAFAHFVLLPSGGEGDRNLLAVPVHLQRAETP